MIEINIELKKMCFKLIEVFKFCRFVINWLLGFSVGGFVNIFFDLFVVLINI